MQLEGKTHLCYISTNYLFEWVEKNNLLVDDYQREKHQWEKEINKEPNFFSDTELLLVYHDTLLLKVSNDNHASFLVKNYNLDYQGICQKVFPEKKNIILISDRQWKEQKNDESAIVLFKDRESSEKSLTDWLEK